MRPLGDPTRPGIARFDVRYDRRQPADAARARSRCAVSISTAACRVVTCSSGRSASFRDRRVTARSARRRAGAAAGRSASGAADRARRPHRLKPVGCTRRSGNVQARRLSARGAAAREPAASQPVPSPRRSAAPLSYTYGPEWITSRRAGWRRAIPTSSSKAARRYRRAIGDAVPRHEPRLAGERSPARRHHDGVRRADAAGRRSAAAARSTA